MEDWLGQLRFLSPADTETTSSHEAIPSSGELLKIILLKRLESSIEAFRSTVVQQLAWCDTALRAIDAGRVLTRPDYRATFRGPADDPGSQLAFFELMLPTPSIDATRMTEYRRALESDLLTLSDVHSALTALGPRGDRKLLKLIQLLDGPLAERKVLIFTEFLDTARYLHRQLRDRPHVAQIDSRSARLGLEPASRREVIERFAPRSNGLPEPPAIERVDLLIATDVLSEGLNLQDASVVVSYDLPWNPVRLMQRIGRIDRLGALADDVELHHFVPARDLEKLLGLMERLRGKVSAIVATIGIDAPVLADADQTVERKADQIRLLASTAEAYTRLEDQLEGPLDPEEQAYLDFVGLADGLRLREGPPDVPTVSAVTSLDDGDARAVAFWKIGTGKTYRALWLVLDRKQCVVEDQAAAVELLRSASQRPTVDPPSDTVDRVRRAFAAYVDVIVAQLEARRVAGDTLNPSLPQCRIAAWLSARLHAARHRLAAGQRALIDALIDRLARRFKAADERLLSRFARELPAPEANHSEAHDDRLLDVLRGLLSSLSEKPSPAMEVTEIGTLLTGK
jgi:hypothetical protein